MNYKDFNLKKTYSMCGVGYFTEHLYAIQFLNGAVSAPEFHCITKEEFDTFDDWKDTSKVRTIDNRPSFGLPLHGSALAEFSEIDVLGVYYQYNLE